MFFQSRYNQNLNRLRFHIDELINCANAKYNTPDCRPYLERGISSIIDNSKEEIKNWDATTDVSLFAHKIFYLISVYHLSLKMH